MDWQSRITTNAEVCHGKPCIKGSRVMVSVVLDNLAAGESAADVAKAYQITTDDVQAALLYAAELAKDRVIPLSVDMA